MQASKPRIPYNEFSEQFTGDMKDSDTSWHYWCQPKYKEMKENWENRITCKKIKCAEEKNHGNPVSK